MTTIYRENAARLSVADAKRLILDAVPLEKAYNVYAREDDEGNIEWEGEIKVVLDEKANIQASHLDNDFLATCDALSICPRNKYRPVLQDYCGNVLQDVIYTIAHDEFVRLAESFGLLVEMGKAPEPQVITTNSAPVVTVSASGGDDETWKSKARIRAYEIIKRDRTKDLYPSQINIADEIAKEFRRDGVMGADGKPIAGSYIKRHALTGISSAHGKQLSTSIRRGK